MRAWLVHSAPAPENGPEHTQAVVPGGDEALPVEELIDREAIAASSKSEPAAVEQRAERAPVAHVERRPQVAILLRRLDEGAEEPREVPRVARRNIEGARRLQDWRWW